MSKASGTRATRCTEPYAGMGGRAKRLCAMAAGRDRSVFRLYDGAGGFRGWQVRDAKGLEILEASCRNLTELERAVVARRSS